MSQDQNFLLSNLSYYFIKYSFIKVLLYLTYCIHQMLQSYSRSWKKKIKNKRMKSFMLFFPNPSHQGLGYRSKMSSLVRVEGSLFAYCNLILQSQPSLTRITMTFDDVSLADRVSCAAFMLEFGHCITMDVAFVSRIWN